MGNLSIPAILFGFVIVYGIYIMVIEPMIGGSSRHRSHDDHRQYRR